MSRISPEHILERAREYRDFTVRMLSEMIGIPSLCGAEEKMVKFLETEFQSCGANEIQIDKLGNIIARVGARGPVIAFDAHLDTVDIGLREQWKTDPFNPTTKDGKIYGRGAADQKGGIAALLTAMRILSEISNDLPFTLFFVGSVQEEDCDGMCWQYITNEDKIHPDIVVLTEPTAGKINRGQRGRMEMEIIVTGKSCHGSTPERGDNAIYKLSPILGAIDKLNGNLPKDPFLGDGTITTTRIRSNAPSLNAIPDMAAAYIDRRLTRGETAEGAMNQIKAMMEIQLSGAHVEVPIYNVPSWRGTTYPTRKIYPTWVLNDDHHLIDYANRCHKALFGKSPKVGRWMFSTNGVATMGIYGIPTFGYGPGDESLAHVPNEYVPIDEIVKASAFYAYFPWIVVGE